MKLKPISTVVAVACAAASAAAHDLPVKGNRAGEEALAIERGARAEEASPKAKARLYSIFARQLTWEQRDLSVCFWNGDAELRNRVARIADELVVGLPVRFVWGSKPTCPGISDRSEPWAAFPIRVSLAASAGVMGKGDNPNAFFSLIGTQSRYDRPTTINLPFDAAPPENELRYRVLHEFCHTLGCLHEHQRAECAASFDRTKIMAQYRLDALQYELNFATIPDGGVFGPIAATGLDEHSVMLYQLKRDMFLPGPTPKCFRDPPANVPSRTDLQGLRAGYGFPVASLGLQSFAAMETAYADLASSRRKLAEAYIATISTPSWKSSNATAVKQIVANLSRGANEAEALAAEVRLSPQDRAEAEAAMALLTKKRSP